MRKLVFLQNRMACSLIESCYALNFPTAFVMRFGLLFILFLFLCVPKQPPVCQGLLIT